jgi:hypothetical protein
MATATQTKHRVSSAPHLETCKRFFYDEKSMLPLDQIADKLHKRELILFIGSGMSAGCYPTWRDLLQELITAHLSGDDQAEAPA